MKATWENRRRGIRLYRGDCMRVLPALRCQADFLLADPCYGSTKAVWDVGHDYQALLPALSERLKPAAVQAWFCCGKFAFRMENQLGKQFRYDLVWEKSNAVGFLDCERKPLRAHESILIACDRWKDSLYHPQKEQGPIKRKGTIHLKFDQTTLYGKQAFEKTRWSDDGSRYPRSVLRFPSEAHHVRRWHPTQKPVDLLEWLIRTYTDPSDLVLDFCGGSGSTAIAAINTGRHCVLIERDRTFFSRAVRRIEEHLAQRRQGAKEEATSLRLGALA